MENQIYEKKKKIAFKEKTKSHRREKEMREEILALKVKLFCKLAAVGPPTFFFFFFFLSDCGTEEEKRSAPLSRGLQWRMSGLVVRLDG